MKQVVQNLRTGDLRVEEVPAPALRPGGLLVRNACSLISAGTERTKIETARKSLAGKARARPDLVRQVIQKARTEGVMKTWRAVMDRLDSDSPLGYSTAGHVLAAAEDVTGFRPGDRVACAGAGYANHAEIVFVPANLAARVPEGVSFAHAAFGTVGAIALQGVRQSRATVGESVAVIGLGLVGQLAVQILRAAGCRVIGHDPDPDARALAERFGARTLAPGLDPERQVLDLTGGHGADAVLIAAGTSSAEPVETAGRIARDRGTVVVLGAVRTDVPRDLYYRKELDLRLSRSYGPGRYDPSYEEDGNDYPIGYVRWTEQRNLEAFLALAAGGALDLDPLVTRSFPVDRAAEAYELLRGAAGGPRAIGIVLEYPEREPAEGRIFTGRPAAGTGGPGVSGGAAARAEAPAVPSGPIARVGVGFLGAGNFAQAVLLPIFRGTEAVDLVGIATASGITARSVASKSGFRYAASDPEEILRDPAVHLVAIATRHDQHAPLAARALAAGKHVFLEKPLALDRESLEGVIEAKRASGRHLVVGFNRRYSPFARELRSRIEGRKGPLVLLARVNAGPIPKEHWTHDLRQGGGRILGEACHFVDLLTFLAGSPPATVHALGVPDPEKPLQANDNVTISIAFADGSVGTVIYAAAGDPGLPKERIEVFGSGISAVIDDFRRAEFHSGGRKVDRSGAQDKGHRAEIQGYLRALREGAAPPAVFEESVLVTLATFAAVESLATGGPVPVG